MLFLASRSGKLFTHACASATKQYNLIPVTEQRCTIGYRFGFSVNQPVSSIRHTYAYRWWGLQPNTRWTAIHRSHVGDGERQRVPGLGVAVSSRTQLRQGSPVSRRRRRGRQQLLSKSGQRRRPLVLHNRSCYTMGILWHASLRSVILRLAVFRQYQRVMHIRIDGRTRDSIGLA